MNELRIRARSRSRFFFYMGVIGLLAVITGFSKTFIIPAAQKTFNAPLSIYVHAVFSFVWVLLFTIQTSFIQLNRTRLHIRLGIAGLVIALGTAVTLVPVAKFVIAKELAGGLGETAYSMGVGVFTTGVIFLALVVTGLFYRKKVQHHKRFLLLATIVLLWPAWFRFRHFFPDIPRPDIWFGVVLADSLIIIAFIWDRIKNGKVHPVLLYFGAAIMIEHALEIILFDSPVWRAIGIFIYNMY